MKKQTIIIIAIVLIAMLASAQDRQIGDQIGKLVKKDEVTISSNVDFQKHGDITTLTFKENNGYIKIRKNLFMNIKKQDKNTNSYLKLDDKGVIIEADFTTTQEGVYIINNDKVNLPPNSRVIYKNNKIKLLIPDNAKIKEMPSVVDQKYGSNFIDIQGKNIGLPGGNTLQEGTLSYLAGKPYIKQGGTATINGLKIESMSKAVEIKFESKGYLQSIKEYFGLSKETGDYVRFSDKIEINGNGFRVKMNPEEFMTDGQQKYTNEYLSTLSLSKSKNGKFFQIGDRGDDVKSIQKLVGVEEDGIFGKKTEQALKNWREENGLSKEGKFDSAALEKALSDSTRNVQITPKGGRVILSKNNNRFNLDFTGDSTLKLGSQVYDIQSAITSGEEQGKVYKRIKTQIANNLEVPTDLTLRDRDGNEISRVVNVEGPGIKETVISFIKEGVRNQGYFTSHYKTSIHVNTVLFDNLPELGSLTADKGIISNTIIPDKYVS
ncbi:MAG: peptidoglycan-binding domain-containing protein, partial [Candidatus Nanoarchaeia archaeon]